MLQEKQIDGLIFKPNCESEDPFSAITIPFVSLSRVENSKFSYVEVENKIGAYMATSYLISRGYNKIAYIGGPRQSKQAQNVILDIFRHCKKMISRLIPNLRHSEMSR